MAQTHMLRPDCPECGAGATEKEHFFAVVPKFIAGEMIKERRKFILLNCGHTITEKQAEQVTFDDIVTPEGKTLRHYQQLACKQVAKAGFRALLRIDVGLGKTIISLSLLKKYWKELTPILIICKSQLTTQWLMEWVEWNDQKLVQVITNGRERPEKGFKAIIVSMDLLRNLEWINGYEPKTIIFDEVQHIKNPDAVRTKIVQDLCKKAQYFLGLSGTPIKNHAGEYFNVLNIIDPRNFRIREHFYNEFIDYYHNDNGQLKLGGLKRTSYPRFKELTEGFIIDYKKEDVAKDLPPVIRDFKYYDLGNDEVKAYRREMNNFFTAYDESEESSGRDKFQAAQAVSQSIMKLRQIVGMAKVEPVVDWTMDWIDEKDEEEEIFNSGKEILRAKPKLVIFIHHIGVGTVLQSRLDQELQKRGFLPTLRLLGGISSDQSSAIETEFKTNPGRRILIASTLASGEGKNFQFCSAAVMMERQWNPPNETQAEGRFPRPGTTAENVYMMYPIAKGTVDDILTRLVEKKRAALATTDGHFQSYTESAVMKEMLSMMAAERKEWR